MRASMTMAVFAVLMAVGCATAVDPSEEMEVGRTGAPKGDAPGMCTEMTCGGMGIGSCYCDDACTGYGDCCANYRPVCLGEDDPPPPPPPDDPPPASGAVPEFGDGSPEITVLANASHGLASPHDLEFNSAHPDQLFIVNQANDSMTVVHGWGTGEAYVQSYSGPGSQHFMARPAALAFGPGGIFATAQEQDQITQPSTPWDFMGPTLWTSQLPLYDGGHRSHIDMLHNSPNAAGIAWVSGNAYFVFDGLHESLTLYDFREDHGPGGNDHSDGVVRRYAEGQVSYVAGVPSHLVMDPTSELLYVADTGNHRVAVLDPTVGSLGGTISPNYDGTDQRHVEGAQLSTLVGDGLEMPSGIEIHDGRLFVSDAANGNIVAYDTEGNELGRIETGAQRIMGLTVGPDGALYFVDGQADTLSMVTP